MDTVCSSFNPLQITRVQSVTELHDGSALFITVAKYLSPALHDIDQVGIAPDVQCTTEMLNSPKESSLMKNKSTAASSLEADSCIMVAEHELDIQESRGSASWNKTGDAAVLLFLSQYHPVYYLFVDIECINVNESLNKSI